MLNVTAAAIDAVRRLCGETHAGLRIVCSRGCGGLTYQLGLEQGGDEADQVWRFDGVSLFVDPRSALWLAGATLDFVGTGAGAGFVFDTPDAGAPPACACASGRCG